MVTHPDHLFVPRVQGLQRRRDMCAWCRVEYQHHGDAIGEVPQNGVLMPGGNPSAAQEAADARREALEDR